MSSSRTRAASRLKVSNLGLDPDEALALGLQVEDVERRKNNKRQPVAEYISPEMKEWIQAHRVEINAMKPSELLRWLDAKMAP